jgi:hypothetical protein
MKARLFIPIILVLMAALVNPTPALSDYQRGVLEGLNRGWNMAQRYDQAKAGDITGYNQAVPDYNSWIEAIFGKNESLLLKPITSPLAVSQYSASRTFKPVHSIDSSWNQTELSLTPEPDSSGSINGIPAEMYYSLGPALESF